MASPSTPHRNLPRRTLNRFALALLGVGIGGLAQGLFRQGSIWDGGLLFILALFFFVRALSYTEAQRPPWLPPYRGLFVGPDLPGGLPAMLGTWTLVAALIASIVGARLFSDEDTWPQAWQVYGLSLLLLFIGLFLATHKRKSQKPPSSSPTGSIMPPERRKNLLVLGGILLLAFGLRLWQFSELPFGVWFDEAQAGLQARRWLAEPDYRPAFFDPINVSGQFLMLYALALRYVSDSVHGLRLASVLFGVGGVWAAYLFGKTVRGPHFGLLMAFFMATMRWDINFSRIAMTGIDTPFFELLSLYFLARLLRRGRLRDAMLTGMMLGLGLTFYTGFRLFGLALAATFLLGVFIWRHWWLRVGDWVWWQNQLLRLLMLLLAGWIIFMPVGQFARSNPDLFSDRIRVTSIFNRRDDPNLMRALRTNIGKHLAMFHISGDKNGRHNLPGEPMLDPLMGILVVLGLGLALRNVFSTQANPFNLFFILLIPAGLVGGVFSLDFEAPQSLRSIAILPALAYFSALAISALATEAKRLTRPDASAWVLWPAGVAALYLVGFNAHTYFVRQANDFAVWNAFSTPETITGQKMADLGPGHDFYLSPFLSNHPSVRFLAGEDSPRYTLPLPDPLPIRSNAARPVALFIHPDEEWVYNLAQFYYPSGLFEAPSNAPENAPSVMIVELTAADLAAVQGLELRYWVGTEIQADQVPVKALRVDTIDVDWQAALPLTPPYIAEWNSVMYVAQYGVYHLILNAPGEAVLEIDGAEVMRGEGALTTSLELARGNHTLRLTAQSGVGKVQLRWQPPGREAEIIPTYAYYSAPVRNNGLLGKYYSNPDWTGSPTFTQIDPFLDIYYHLTPLPRPYSVAWSGMLDVPVTGIYGLGIWSVGRSQLYLDGQLVTEASNNLPEATVSLTAGLHEIEVRFQDTEPRSRIHLLWRAPGGVEFEPIPSRQLWPSLESVQATNLQLAPGVKDFVARPITFSHLTTFSENLIAPRDIALGPDNIVYVVDSEAGLVQLFGADGSPLGSITETPDGPFREPLGIVAASDGTIWVLDSGRQWVYGFDEGGHAIGQIGGPEAQFYHPRGLSLFSQPDASDTLVVANTGSGNLRLFSLDGTSLGSVGFFGDGPGQFNEPVDALRDQFGAYYVTEGANVNRWQRVDPFGKALASWVLDSPVALNGSHMDWGPDGSILMTNSARGVLRRYAPDGRLLEEWSELAGVRLIAPVGILVAGGEQLYLSDIGSGQVHRFQFEILEEE